MDMPPFYALLTRVLPHEDLYDRLGEIQRCLLETPPFQGCKADEIQDLRYPSAPPMPCKNRPELITNMMIELYGAGRIEDFRKMAPEALRDITLEAFALLGWLWGCFLTLRSTRALSARARWLTEDLRQKGTQQGLTDLFRSVCSFNRADFRACQRLITPSCPLVVELYPLLRDHVTKGTDLALYYALASILIAFGFENGSQEDLEPVARRLRKRVQRALRAAQA